MNDKIISMKQLTSEHIYSFHKKNTLTEIFDVLKIVTNSQS